MKNNAVFLAFVLLLTGSCTQLPVSKVKPARHQIPEIDFSRGTLKVDLGAGKAWELESVWPDTATDEQIEEVLLQILESYNGKSPVSTRKQIPADLRNFHLSSVTRTPDNTKAVYTLDTLAIRTWLLRQVSHGNLYFSSGLFTQDSMPVFELLLPVDSVPVPESDLFLPNSARTYRNGIHRGIDFQVNWGTPFKAIADGVVVRADHRFTGFSPEQWLGWSSISSDVGRTPDDLFYNVFMGRALIIDHGFNLFPGYRTISIYAHLEEIGNDILPGTRVERGQVLGVTGNSGTLPAARGERGQAHLHLEVILQGKNGDTYLGQDTSHEDLYPYLSRIFTP